jgi:hypothetical protein
MSTLEQPEPNPLPMKKLPLGKREAEADVEQPKEQPPCNPEILTDAPRKKSAVQPPGARDKRKATRFGDDDFAIENVNKSIAARLILNDEDNVSWIEIWHSCCLHSKSEWTHIAGAVFAMMFCLYFLLFGMQLMGSASKVMAGCASGELFGNDVSAKFTLRLPFASTMSKFLLLLLARGPGKPAEQPHDRSFVYCVVAK